MTTDTSDDARHEALAGQLHGLAAAAADAAGVELVELRVSGPSRRRRIRVDIDRAGPVSVSHEDCRLVSTALDRAIEHTGTLSDEYTLEVSSPGVERPIRSDDDARRNVGRRVVVTLHTPVDGQREFRGLLRSSDMGTLRVVDDALGEVCIPRDRIAVARQDIAF